MAYTIKPSVGMLPISDLDKVMLEQGFLKGLAPNDIEKVTEENLQYIIQGATAVFDVGMVFAKDQKLPIDLFMSKTSEINIFINGAAYGKDFTKVKNQDTLVLTNMNIVSLLVPGDKITFEWR